MIFGKIYKNDKIIKMTLDIRCTKCGAQVPGGIKTSEKYYNSKSFSEEINNFKKNYLCGKCRDKKRISQNLKNQN